MSHGLSSSDLQFQLVESKMTETQTKSFYADAAHPDHLPGVDAEHPSSVSERGQDGLRLYVGRQEARATGDSEGSARCERRGAERGRDHLPRDRRNPGPRGRVWPRSQCLGSEVLHADSLAFLSYLGAFGQVRRSG